MAQYDTGLGWEAKEDWLANAADAVLGWVGSATSADFPGQPIPVSGPFQPDIVSRNYRICSLDDIITGIVADFYATASMHNTFAVWGADGYIYFLSLAAGCEVYVARVPTTGEIQTISLTDAHPYTGYTIYVGRARFAYAQYRVIYQDPPVNTSINFYSQAAGYLQSNLVVVQHHLTKSNDGFGVFCRASWRTSTGDIRDTIVGLSTDRDYVQMESDTAMSANETGGIQMLGVNWTLYYLIPPAGMTVLWTSMPYVDLHEYRVTSEQLAQTIALPANANIRVPIPPDPYDPGGGGNQPHGGDGEDPDDDDMGTELHGDGDTPTALGTGFCRIYCPSKSQLQALSSYLWSASYDLDQVKRLFTDPMGSILGLSAVPVQLIGTNMPVSLGGLIIEGLTMPMVTQQYHHISMGAVTVEEKYGSYLDYDPYTKFSVVLPFIGIRDVSADDIMGKTVGLEYDIDILSGSCVARLQAGSNCLYQWAGQCAMQLPVNSRNWDSIFSTAVSVAASVGSAAVGGIGGAFASAAISAAGQVTSAKLNIERSGSIAGAASWLGQLTPYLIRTSPVAAIPAGQNRYIGYPAYTTVLLGDLEGYNEVESIHLQGVPATAAELEEIDTLLKGGVEF